MRSSEQKHPPRHGLILKPATGVLTKVFYVCEARRPSGGVSRQIAHTPRACDPGRIAGSEDNTFSHNLNCLFRQKSAGMPGEAVE